MPLSPEEFAEKTWREAQRFMVFLLELFHATSQEDCSSGADYLGAEVETQENPFQ